MTEVPQEDPGRTEGADFHQEPEKKRANSRLLVVILGYLVVAVAGTSLVLAILPWLRYSNSAVRWTQLPPHEEAVEVARVNLKTGSLPVPGVAVPKLNEEGELFDDSRLDRYRDVALAKADNTEKIIPRSQRWQVYFPPGLSEGPYARQVDALGVEFGVILGDGNVLYVSGISKGKPQTKTGKLSDEKRLYLTWSRGDLLAADRTLLQNAGIKQAIDKIILHFCPQGTEDRMAELEHKYQDREPKDIFLTRFALKRTFQGYRLFVMEQIPRN